MKYFAVILLLTVQLGLLLNKTLTIVHFFLHRAEIVEHFCHHSTHQEEENCQGICYLNAELSQDDNSPVKNFPFHSLVQEEVVYIETLPSFRLESYIFKDKILNTFFVDSVVSQNNHLSVWRPPTA